MDSIYINSENFKGSIPPLPDPPKSNSDDDKNHTFEKAYVVDGSNTSDDKSVVLVYDPGEYPINSSQSVYKTNIKDWLSLPEDEREKIQYENNIVSDNLLPENIKKELSTISNISYTMGPIYKQNDTIHSIYIATQSGILYKYSPDSSSVRFDPRERNWYINAVNSKKDGNDKAVWQTPYIDRESGKLCITCSRAFCNNKGEILGVVACDMYLSEMNKKIVNSQTSSIGYAFILDKDGKFVMHPSYDAEGEIGNFNPAPLEDDIDPTYRSVLTDMKEGKSGVQRAKTDGREYYISYFPMEETGWSLGIASEINEIIAPSTQTKTIIDQAGKKSQSTIDSKISKLLFWLAGIFVICCAVSLFFAYVISLEIIKPINKLKQGVKKIGEGDLSFEIKVDTQDEVGELAGAFNKMTKDLNSYIKNLAETTAEKERINSELSIAKQIQLGMLPCIFPAFPERDDFDIYAITDPAKEVGGDFYDFFFVDDSHLAIVIADVSGKGIPSALFMVISKILIKNQLLEGMTPAKTLEIVNNQLYENNEAGMFVTAFVGVYDIKTGEFVFSNAGHNPPLLYRKGRDRFETIKMDHGFVLAGISGRKYKDYKINMSKDDIIFMYTDGVTEASNSKSEMFSDERLKEVLNSSTIRHLNIRDMIIDVKSEIQEFASGAPKFDDMTIMAFKVLKKFLG